LTGGALQMWLNMMKCCGKMDCRTQEALVCQLMRDPSDSYLAAAKALEASVVYDASTAYLSLIFDSRLMEFAAGNIRVIALFAIRVFQLF
jgi:hypothetical protein